LNASANDANDPRQGESCHAKQLHRAGSIAAFRGRGHVGRPVGRRTIEGNPMGSNTGN
jgi:hypothetical protein